MKELARSLAELDLGLKGDLQMSERMEVLQLALAENRVPSTWEALAYPSKRPLGMWFLNFIERHRQLSDWTAELGLPKLTWISGLFNPQSFLTAIMQTSARKNDWPLDKMVVQTEVTKKLPEEIQVISLLLHLLLLLFLLLFLLPLKTLPPSPPGFLAPQTTLHPAGPSTSHASRPIHRASTVCEQGRGIRARHDARRCEVGRQVWHA
jgi:hypothetical protein